MLIVPVFNKTSRKIPWVCIILIVLNALVYIFLQSDDDRIYGEAQEYYVSSKLIDIELQAYLGYLQAETHSLANSSREDEKSRSEYLSQMFSDDEFLFHLLNKQIITPGSDGFEEWHSKRSTYEDIKNRAVIFRYGYSPRENKLITLFTCTFLHGGIMHLVGNMVFLWLVGAVLEKALGLFYFALLYCLCGICASGLFGIIYPLSPGPLVGASGAIAGLMGAYGVIFSLRKIKVFYSVGFYFNYALVPAIALFPAWLANEFFQLYTNQGSQVAYIAHIGGLLSGASIGIYLKIIKKEHINTLFHQEEKQDKLEQLLENGLQKFMALEMDKARDDFARALALDANNKSAIKHLFIIDKTAPQSEKFHQSAHRLLASIAREDREEYIKIFEEYKSVSQKPRVTIELLERLAHSYLVIHDYDKAATCIASLLKRSPGNPKIPGFLLELGHGFRQHSKMTQAMKCYRILSQKYGTTAEADQAALHLAPKISSAT